MTPISYKRRCFPPIVIQHVVWLHFRFTLSLRDVEGMVAHRGVYVSDETIRAWAAKVMDMIVQKRRYVGAALRLMRRLLKNR